MVVFGVDKVGGREMESFRGEGVRRVNERVVVVLSDWISYTLLKLVVPNSVGN